MNTFSKITLILAVAGFAAASPAALAGSSDDVPSVVVSYGDLDLTKSGGAQKLSQRIQSAARSVCEKSFPDRALRNQGEFKQCIANSTARAVAQVDSPLLTALHTKPVQSASR